MNYLSYTLYSVALILGSSSPSSTETDYSYDVGEYKNRAELAGEDSFAYIPLTSLKLPQSEMLIALGEVPKHNAGRAWVGYAVSSQRNILFRNNSTKEAKSAACFNLFPENAACAFFNADWSVFDTPENIGANTQYYPERGFVAFLAPFNCGEYSFLCISPRGTTTLGEIENYLSTPNLRRVICSLKPRRFSVIRLPCVKISMKHLPNLFRLEQLLSETVPYFEFGPAGVGRNLSTIKIIPNSGSTSAIDRDYMTTKVAFEPETFEDNNRRDFVFFVIKNSDKTIQLAGRYAPGRPIGLVESR